MRMTPLVMIVVLVVLVGASFGTTFLWVIAGISSVALGVLIYFMVREKQYHGPRVLVDEARDRIDAMGREPVGDETESTDESEYVLVKRKK